MSTVSSKASFFFFSVSYTCHVKKNFLCVARKLFRVMSSSSKMFHMVDVALSQSLVALVSSSYLVQNARSVFTIAWLRKKVRRCYHMMSVPQTTWENSPGFPPLFCTSNQKLPRNEPMSYVTLWLVKTLYHDHMCSRYTSLAVNGSTAASVCMMYLHFSCYSMLWGWVSHKWPIQL